MAITITTKFASTLDPFVLADINNPATHPNFLFAGQHLDDMKAVSFMAPELLVEKKNTVTGVLEVRDMSGIQLVRAVASVLQGYQGDKAQLEYGLHLWNRDEFSGQYGLGVIHSSHKLVERQKLPLGWYQVNARNGAWTFELVTDPERDLRHTLINALLYGATVFGYIGSNGGRAYWHAIFDRTPEERTQARQRHQIADDLAHEARVFEDEAKRLAAGTQKTAVHTAGSAAIVASYRKAQDQVVEVDLTRLAQAVDLFVWNESKGYDARYLVGNTSHHFDPKAPHTFQTFRNLVGRPGAVVEANIPLEFVE